MANFFFWLRSLGNEFCQPLNYVLAFLVGVLINTLQTENPFSSLAAFLVPVFVQAFSKSFLRYSQRHQQTLLRLPGERLAPAFVMDKSGYILASAGWTKQFLQKDKIQFFQELFPSENQQDLLIPGMSVRDCPRAGCKYLVRIQESSKDLLVWCEDGEVFVGNNLPTTLNRS
ncbi:MAG: hypothetical protein HKM06_02850 [Spirochaetales bacterium]|nr:hypothetical protein [Spirochaetales bacterium]